MSLPATYCNYESHALPVVAARKSAPLLIKAIAGSAVFTRRLLLMRLNLLTVPLARVLSIGHAL